MIPLRGLCIGAGYFSRFHLDAWNRLEGVTCVGVCDLDIDRAQAAAKSHDIDRWFDDPARALDELRPDFADLITPPETHLDLIQRAAERSVPIICQKPLAPDLPTSQRIVEICQKANVRLMVHENFRFQPWHREIKRLLEDGVIGELHTLSVRTRLGDGWGAEAYLDRQPYFRTMERLLIFETGVHFLDTFRYLGGEITDVYAKLRRLNPAIVGEDAATLQVTFRSGAIAMWDANRYNESTSEHDDPRYTFGTFLLEGTHGSISLGLDGQLTIKPLGERASTHTYDHQRIGFAGDCVLATQQHFLDALRTGQEFETDGQSYLKIMMLMEAAYRSDQLGQPVRVGEVSGLGGLSGRVSAAQSLLPQHEIIDLSLPIDNMMPGVEITPARIRSRDGWNATTLSLYSHSGTHMDAPRHFLDDRETIDKQALEICLGPAQVIDLTPVQPSELIGVGRLGTWADRVQPGDRLLLRTDWSERRGTPAYRDQLPRISTELADWLVRRQVALIGVEPPSVADVNNLGELTEVHRILLDAGVVIVEGLNGLDRIPGGCCQLIVLPLRIVDGDGSPVRALALVPQDDRESGR